MVRVGAAMHSIASEASVDALAAKVSFGCKFNHFSESFAHMTNSKRIRLTEVEKSVVNARKGESGACGSRQIVPNLRPENAVFQEAPSDADFVTETHKIDLFRYISRQPPWSNDSRTDITVTLRALRQRLRSPDSGKRKNALLSGDLARLTREHWRTKCQRRPRRGAESLRSSHAVESMRVER